MAKIKELLAGREKLAKYDELTEWKKRFEDMDEIPAFVYGMPAFVYGMPDKFCSLPLPDHIKEIIVNALDAEIKKIEKE